MRSGRMGPEGTSRKAAGPPGAVLARALAFLLVVCLVDCAAEQRTYSRGIKTPSLVERANGWRSQRGAACTMYGHSCWGAHGKRSTNVGTDEAQVLQNQFLNLLRRVATERGSERNSMKQMNRDDLYDSEPVEDYLRREMENNNIVDGDESPDASATEVRRRPMGIPMLDEDTLKKAKLIRLMKGVGRD